MNDEEIKCFENFLKIRNIIASTLIKSDQVVVDDGNDGYLINYIPEPCAAAVNRTALELIIAEVINTDKQIDWFIHCA